MDIRKLQRAIVEGLEDVKAQGIQVFDTEHLSPLFERVVIASGTSNRQTKALAASVRDSVKASGHQVLRVEGEANGEWIIVDCGAAVVHVMQPSIREYYHLEEIWGEKSVKLKADKPVKLVKASEPESAAPAKKGAAKKSPAKKAAAKAPAVKKAAAKKPAVKAVAEPVARKAPAKKVAAKTSATKKVAAKKAATVVTRTVGVKSGGAAAKKVAAKAPAKKAAAKKTSSRA